MVHSLAFVGGLVVDFRRSKFHVVDPNLVLRVTPLFSRSYRLQHTENCIVFATTGHARFEHARVLNNKMRAILRFSKFLQCKASCAIQACGAHAVVQQRIFSDDY